MECFSERSYPLRRGPRQEILPRNGLAGIHLVPIVNTSMLLKICLLGRVISLNFAPKPVCFKNPSQSRHKSTTAAIKRGLIRTRVPGASSRSRVSPQISSRTSPESSIRSRAARRKSRSSDSSSTWENQFDHTRYSRPAKAKDWNRTDGSAQRLFESKHQSAPRQNAPGQHINDYRRKSFSQIVPLSGHRSRLQKEHVSSDPFMEGPESIRASHTPTPRSIPYTTAASEFLFGNSVVSAALRTRKRKAHKLYIHPRARSGSDSAAAKLLNTARRSQVEIVDVTDAWLPLMDKMSQGRPHNGIILEASPLPTWPASALEAPQPPAGLDAEPNAFRVTNDSTPHSASSLRFQSDGWRQPFVMMVDDVVRERDSPSSCIC